MRKCRDCDEEATHNVSVYTSQFSQFPSVTYECCKGHADSTARRFERSGHPTTVQSKRMKASIDKRVGRI